jgi:P-type E1-E2 ATPase
MKVDLSAVEDRIAELSEKGKTVILVGPEDGLMGMITVRDLPREESREVVDGLKAMGMKVVMLTGDDVRVAEGVARTSATPSTGPSLPLDTVRAGGELRRQFGPC